jgi:MoaA/NifB/PqqE/SkfB family radical SAM enzyme
VLRRLQNVPERGNEVPFTQATIRAHHLQSVEANMIQEVTGIRQIHMLYLQLLYRCNFECLHCFHGERLRHSASFTRVEAVSLIRLMRDEYGTEAVTFLGGEPFLYKDLPAVVSQAKREFGLRIEICTNGYRIERRLAEIRSDLDFLRISLEGIGTTNDRIRRPGSYDAAISALRFSRELGIPTGVTLTVTSLNISEIVTLARQLEDLGACQLKLHSLRSVGNAAHHSELLVTEPTAYTRLRDQLGHSGLRIDVLVDEDLSGGGAPEACSPRKGVQSIQRIEADPRGALTMSCKAVGKDAHAFWYDKADDRIVYRPSVANELVLGVPDVIYAHV